MGLDLQYFAYLCGRSHDIDTLHTMLTQGHDTPCPFPKNSITPLPISAHQHLCWLKGNKMKRIRKVLNRPYPLPVSLAEIDSRTTSTPHTDTPNIQTPADRLSLPSLLAAVLATQNTPDIPAEYLPHDTLDLINNTLNNGADDDISITRHALAGDRAVLAIESGWTRGRYTSCFHLLPALYMHPPVPFDLIEMSRLEMEPTREYQAGRGGKPLTVVSPLGCRHVYDPHGFDGTPTYSYRRRLAAMGFEQDVLNVVFGEDDATHRALHHACIMESRTVIREDREAALMAKDNPQQTAFQDGFDPYEIPF